jgi:hypothetical protein
VRARLPSSEAELDLRRRAGAGPERLRPPARASVGRVRASRVAGLAQRGRGAARRPDPCWHLVAHAAVSPPCPARTARAAAELLPPRTCRQLPSAWSQPSARRVPSAGRAGERGAEAGAAHESVNHSLACEPGVDGLIGVPHTERWGDVVVSAFGEGGHTAESAAACCQSCAKHRDCNVWVWCAAPDSCQQQCWLKRTGKAADLDAPAHGALPAHTAAARAVQTAT